MKLTTILKMSYRSILRNKMRSFLTSLGIIIGVCSVIVMVAIANGSAQQIKNNISSMGTNLIMVNNARMMMQGVSSSSNQNRLTFDDVDYLRKNSQLIDGFSAQVRTRAQIIGGSGNWNSSVEGVDPDYIKIRKWEINLGKIFTDKDVESKKKVCLIGATVVENLFPSGSPIGQRIRVNNIPFTVIGVLKEKGENTFGQDQDDVVMMPSTTALYRLSGEDHINQIYLSAKSEDQIDAAIAEVEALLRKTHKLKDYDDSDFMIRSQSEMNEMASSTTKTMSILLGAIAGVSLIVGGIGIMNIMLVSVTERTREIGIRLSIGARQRDVLVQFLTEAIVLSLSGGIVGVMLAFTLIFVSSHYFNLPAIASTPNVLFAFSFAGIIGVFFGWYPAKKAATLNPIDALRHE